MIRLTDNLFVTADKYQYILGTPKERPKKDGDGTETVMTNPKYYRTLAQVLRAAVGLELRKGIESGDIETLSVYARKLEQLTSDFDQKLSVFDL